MNIVGKVAGERLVVELAAEDIAGTAEVDRVVESHMVLVHKLV